MKRTLAFSLLLASGVALFAADRPHFDSRAVDGAITVDGSFDDWNTQAGSLAPFGKDPVSIQALNDGTFLYVRLSASDPGVRGPIVRRGLTIWFDPNGGTKKRFGIRYPVIEDPGQESGGGGYRGMGGFGGRRQPSGGGGDSGSGGSAGTAANDSEQPPDRVDIVGPGKDDEISLTREHLEGVDVGFKVEQGALQYELRVPLARSADMPYAIGTAPGATIGIGLETPKPLQRSFDDGRGGGFGGGGMGGGFGGSGRGGYGRGGMGGHRDGGERSFQPPKPLKDWGTVTLK
jgi:hypothetical protein